jgi:site-specific DNA recombinase
MTAPARRLRCAVYTRKSTEEGLEQQFNSLDAQRESCEAYVLSQAGEGWECLSDLYDDGGWSGGNMERPALKRLLEDIGKGRIDVVVVYKVDRLTRSLMDFARIVERFDANSVSFVSVTQAFNTTSSMGRLTLNVLLSFAQFEREVTGERIRDKIAASKARGMWMGGIIPLGYDLGERKLLVNETEAEQVRQMFRRYLDLGSIPALAKELAAQSRHSKRWISRNGRVQGGMPFRCGGISHILNNRIYLGEIVHRGKVHPGDHEPIIEPSLFEAVQAKLANNRHRHVTRKTRAAACPLTGKLYDSEGQPMRPSFSYGRGSKMYRYYVSETLLPNGKIGNTDNMAGERLSADRIERLLLDRLSSLLPTGMLPDGLFDLITRAASRGERLDVSLDAAPLITEGFCSDMLLGRVQDHVDANARIDRSALHLSIDARPVRRGKSVRAKVHLIDDPEQRAILADLVRISHRKLRELHASPLQPDTHTHMRAPSNDWTRARVAIGFLAPDIQKALLQGTAPKHLDPDRLLSRDMPLDWHEQRRFLGIAI